MTTADLHPEVRKALDILIGGGLDERGKDVWIQMRLDDGATVIDLFIDALALMDA